MPSVAISTGLFILAACLFSALTTAWGLFRFEARRNLHRRPDLSADLSQTTFLFDGKLLANATPSALRFVGAPVNRNAVWLKLQTRLELFCPGVANSMNLLLREGREFRTEISSGEKTFQMDGRMDGGLIRISFVEPEMNVPSVAVSSGDMGFLQDLARFDPVPAWRVDVAGRILWANERYRKLCDVAQDAPVVVFAPDTPQGRPVRVDSGPEKGAWFELSISEMRDGDRLCFAMPASNTIRAEEALKRFVQTLTKTFAHIPIGIAIFDRDRHLAMFNPAISDMTKLSPDWLSKRPHLNAFLDRLRDSHHLPEPKDYKSWKHRMVALIRAAESGTYEENWSLPTGETFRVSGRPHPEGAIAFLFEDISPTIALQRQVRSELELGQAVFDTLDHAVAAFSNEGELVLSNDAFVQIWGFDPRELLSPLYLGGALELWQADCQKTKPLSAFRKAIQSREIWKGTICHSETGALQVQVIPLTHGSLLVSFATDQRATATEKSAAQTVDAT